MTSRSAGSRCGSPTASPRGIKPRRIVYQDALLTRPVLGGRLRPIPSGAYRGYTLDLVEPVCGQTPGKATVTVTYDDDVETFPVDDETGVVERWADERCDEIAVERIADLEWTSGIEVQGSGSDAVALFRLTATPTGRAGGGALTVDTVGGTPLFTSADGDFWTVGQRVRSDGPVVTMELPAQPARCDSHAFGAATGGTTFFVNITIGQSRPAQIRLAMSPEVTAEAFEYAAEVCGWDEAMRLAWTARTRRLFFVVVMLLAAHLPADLDAAHPGARRAVGRRRDGHGRRDRPEGRGYLVAFRFPEDVDPDQRRLLRRGRAGVVREGCRRPSTITVRVLEGRPEAHRVEGEIHSKAAVRFVGVADRDRAGGRSVVGQGRPPPAAGAPARPRSSRARGRRGDAGSWSGCPTRTSTRPSAPCSPPTTPRPCSTSANAAWSWPSTAHPHPVEVGSRAPRVRGAVIG